MAHKAWKIKARSASCLLRGGRVRYEVEWDAWLTVQERAVYEPLLSEPYVLDIDNTVTPLRSRRSCLTVAHLAQKNGARILLAKNGVEVFGSKQ